MNQICDSAIRVRNSNKKMHFFSADLAFLHFFIDGTAYFLASQSKILEIRNWLLIGLGGQNYDWDSFARLYELRKLSKH